MLVSNVAAGKKRLIFEKKNRRNNFCGGLKAAEGSLGVLKSERPQAPRVTKPKVYQGPSETSGRCCINTFRAKAS